MSRLTEDKAYQKVLNYLKQKDEANLLEISRDEHITKGSLHRWLVKWKNDKKIGYTIRTKKTGLGVEEVYYLPEIMLIEEKLERFLKEKNALKEGKTFIWDVFPRLAVHLKIDHTKPEFKNAVINLAKRYKFLWLPKHEPPE
jgi:hypothetical protein